MNNKEILDNAPDAEGCAVDVAVNTKKAEIMYIKRNARGDKIYRKGKGWNYLKGTLGTHWTIRSLEDIKRIVELEKERDDLNGKFEEYFDAFMNCKCIPRNMEVHNLEQQVKGIKSLKFPTMLRKMWTGGDVQKWILEQAKAKGGAD
jgi:hypothetical protein